MYRITYVLGGDKAYRDKAMRILLATLTLTAKEYVLRTPDAPAPKSLGYEDECDGQDDWLDASALAALKKGDCEDLAAYTAGWLQAKKGILAWPQLEENADGHTHVVVELPNGRRFDPTLFAKNPRSPSAHHACTGHGKDKKEQHITFVTDLFKSKTTVIGFRGDRNAEQSLAHKSLTLMLHALFLIDCMWLKAHPESPNLYEAGVRYEEEPPGREDWQDIPSTIGRKGADCEDLATWRAAELTVRQNIKARPTFIWRMRASGAMLYHIQTTYPDGRVEDPSRRLGMGQGH